MSEESRTILLKFSRPEFEEFYEVRKHGNILRNPCTRTYVIAAIIFTIGLAVSFFFAINWNRLVVLTVLLFIGLCFVLIGLYLAARPFFKWKRDTIKWIDKISTFKHQKLVLTPFSIVLVQDDTETIEKWSTISNVKIESNYIMIKGSEQFMFPKGSMEERDFEFLKDRVSEVMKNGL